MSTHTHHDRPMHDGLHPLVYRSMIALTIWLVLSVWVFFNRGAYVGLTLAMITVFFVILVGIPVLGGNQQTQTVPETPLAGIATNTALGGERLDLHNVAKFS
jgi:hypothetical protein